MGVVERIRKMVAAGLSYEMALDIAESFEGDFEDAFVALKASVLTAPAKDEAAERRREKDRERKRPRKSAEIPWNGAEVEQKVSPAPPSKTQEPITPSPPKGGTSPLSVVAEQLWALQPKKHRRSTKPDVVRATQAAAKRGAKSAELITACEAYYRHPDRTKSDGEFAMGAARLLEKDRWREFLPSLEPPTALTEKAMARAVSRFHETGEWHAEWGPSPENRQDTASLA